ncbi:MAG TPA: hypothetical protein VHB99_08760 [Pirellulales bacterium]|nr:hypothetical protein [Pirellulales bacterium]
MSRFQFRLKVVFAVVTTATLLLATVGAITGTTTTFGTFLGAMTLCAIATLTAAFFLGAILYLAFFLTVILFEPQAMRPSGLQLRMALVGLAVTVGALLLVIRFIAD